MWNQGMHVAGFMSAAVQQTLQQNPLNPSSQEAKGADPELYLGDQKKMESFLCSI